ncbi:CoA ester lyase [Arthrobacter zhangbolii]|uniref:CoA ester lyase n=1 Tax=Arthrobacter zhangbolii TaxID=2886936 RepID=A0A9X1S9N5_9MICC|nr:CoA ester lyase [Arthrobacter zhangbolii]MCC3273298.1 CoA ester lyase [Arthrobacter zhangbolii]UON92719.1 CoA ester lyase [Arthrobacter zhangbolii]
MPSTPAVLPRSFLYVPGNKPDLFPKAAAGAADALILDLEDAVPLDRKDEARTAVGRWLTAGAGTGAAGASPRPEPRQQQWVRLNPDSFDSDLHAVTGPALDGVFLAKCSRAVLEGAAGVLAELEIERDLPAGSIGIIGLIEDAAALAELDDIVRSRRLVTLALGEVDLLADLRMARTAGTAAALDSLRTRLVVACAAAGLSAPVAPTSTAIRDTELFERTGRHLHDLGFRSRTAIHPSQVELIHKTFTPDDAALAAARELVGRFDGQGGGVGVDSEGRLIDAAVIRSARETLGRASAAPRE